MTQGPDRLGVIADLVAGRWVDPGDGTAKGIPIERIEIADSLAGREAELVRSVHGDRRLCVVHDAFTREALGGRVLDALRRDGLRAEEHVWERPEVNDAATAALSHDTADAEVLDQFGTNADSYDRADFMKVERPLHCAIPPDSPTAVVECRPLTHTGCCCVGARSCRPGDREALPQRALAAANPEELGQG